MACAEFGSMLSDFPPLSYLTCLQPHSIQCPGDAGLVLKRLHLFFSCLTPEKNLSLWGQKEQILIRILSQGKLCPAYVSL